MQESKPVGRPSLYTPELGEKICDLIAVSECGLDELCEKHEFMPNESTVRLWRFKHPEFSTKYLQAKQFQAELFAESTDKIARELRTYIDAEGNERIDPGAVAWQKLRVNTRQWHASKLAPKIWGDKKQEDSQTPEQTLSKIQALVADLNKTNVSDI